MFRIIGVSKIVVALSAILFLTITQNYTDQAFADTGGPDAFGYCWVDNDNGGGPTFHWINITRYGTLVQGLNDDNTVGPFEMGFNFSFYGNIVNRFWIGSNGHINFSINTTFAYPYPNIPSTNQPNNLIAPLGGDLDFVAGGTCYYWTNNTDSLIVSWINVREFAFNDSSHTFQVILSAQDSSILFQYGANRGHYSTSIPSVSNVIGIEDSTGMVGIQYIRNCLPSERMWHDSLAIKFFADPDTTFRLHNIAVLAGNNDRSEAILIPADSAFIPKVLLQNTCAFPEINIPVLCEIKNNEDILFTQLDTFPLISAFSQEWVSTSRPFLPLSPYKNVEIRFSVSSSDDMNPLDNQLSCELDSYLLPDTLRYDEGVDDGVDFCFYICGHAQEFQIADSVKVKGIQFYSNYIFSPGTAYVCLIGNSVNDKPELENIAASDSIWIDHVGWYTVIFNEDLIFDYNEKFYAAILIMDQGSFSIGGDISIPHAKRNWNFADSIFYRRNELNSSVDPKIRVIVENAGYIYCDYKLGDINGDSLTTALDISYAVNYFKGGIKPVVACSCPPHGTIFATGDINGSCLFNGIDIIYLVNYFKGGPAPVPCPDCPPEE
jgi:hypothetical protein